MKHLPEKNSTLTCMLPHPWETGIRLFLIFLCTATLIAARSVVSVRAVPPKTGLANTGFRVKPGMTYCAGSVSPCLALNVLPVSPYHASSLTVKDEVGREVILPFPPKRIISLAPNVTEILFTLGLDEEIVGVSTHCNFPEKAKTKPRIGSYISLDFERIISLRPDVIIATAAGNTREMVKRLEEYGFPTYVIFPKDFDGILSSIEHIGRVVNRKKEALATVQEMKRRRDKVIEITRNLPRPKVFLQIGEAPIVTAGRGSFSDDLIRLAGGENVAGEEKNMYPRFGMEEIIKRAPEIILISTHNPNADYQKVSEEWSRWKTIPAVKTGRIHLINSDLIDRPSPRIIDGLEEMARIYHPEQFKKK